MRPRGVELQPAARCRVMDPPIGLDAVRNVGVREDVRIS